MAKWQVIALAVLATAVVAFASSQVAQPAPAAQPASSGRQTALGAGGILSGIASMLPSAFSNMLPLVVLFGLGALMVPALGLGLLLREGRRSDHPYYYRSFPSFNINTSAIMDGMSDVFERVMKALDNVDKKYN